MQGGRKSRQRHRADAGHGGAVTPDLGQATPSSGGQHAGHLLDEMCRAAANHGSAAAQTQATAGLSLLTRAERHPAAAAIKQIMSSAGVQGARKSRQRRRPDAGHGGAVTPDPG